MQLNYMKICCKCKKSLSLDKFYKRKQSKDGYNSRCGKCCYEDNNPYKTKYYYKTTKNCKRKGTIEHSEMCRKRRLGKKLSDETKLKISNSTKGKPHYNQRLENNPNWMGGISFEIYPKDWNDALREKIRKFFNCRCVICGKEQKELKGRKKKLEVHHIDYDKNNCSIDNLVSLCHICHMGTNAKRDYWVEYFNKRA